MKNSLRFITLMTLSATVAGAQERPMGAPGGGRSAQMLLARSAELDLTDAQIVKLAAIARKAETRQRARSVAMDSARTRFTQPVDSLARRAFARRMQGEMERERDQSRVDLRDALAILTPDQQAKAWEMNANRGRARRDGGPGRNVAPRMQRPRPEMGGRMRPDGVGPDRRGAPDGMGRGEMRPRRPRPQNEEFPPVYETR
jgi:Spy/CpxP family protein refolding chaperone